MTLAALAFEGLVCLLLAAAAVMCWRVDRRLRTLREGQDGLKETIASLNDAVDRARASLAALDRAAREQGASLKSDVEQARRLSDELRFLGARADEQVSRLSQRPQRAPAPRAASAAPEADAARRRLETLKAMR
jgi:chromosome segregation ATPase